MICTYFVLMYFMNLTCTIEQENQNAIKAQSLTQQIMFNWISEKKCHYQHLIYTLLPLITY